MTAARAAPSRRGTTGKTGIGGSREGRLGERAAPRLLAVADSSTTPAACRRGRARAPGGAPPRGRCRRDRARDVRRRPRRAPATWAPPMRAARRRAPRAANAIAPTRSCGPQRAAEGGQQPGRGVETGVPHARRHVDGEDDARAARGPGALYATRPPARARADSGARRPRAARHGCASARQRAPASDQDARAPPALMRAPTPAHSSASSAAATSVAPPRQVDAVRSPPSCPPPRVAGQSRSPSRRGRRPIRASSIRFASTSRSRPRRDPRAVHARALGEDHGRIADRAHVPSRRRTGARPPRTGTPVRERDRRVGDRLGEPAQRREREQRRAAACPRPPAAAAARPPDMRGAVRRARRRPETGYAT